MEPPIGGKAIYSQLAAAEAQSGGYREVQGSNKGVSPNTILYDTPISNASRDAN